MDSMYPRVLVRVEADEGRIGAAMSKLAEAQTLILDALNELKVLGVLHLKTEEAASEN